MKKLSALLLAFALLLSLTPARADTLGLYFGARQVYYTPGKPATLTVRAMRAAEADTAFTVTDGRGGAYSVTLPKGKDEIQFTVDDLPTAGSKTRFALTSGVNYVRRTPGECVAVPRGMAAFSFGESLYQTYVDREFTCRVNIDNPGALAEGTTVTLRDQDGTELFSFAHQTNRQAYKITFTTDQSWAPGKRVSIWVEGRDCADDTALMAVGVSGVKAIWGVDRSDNKIAFTMDCGSHNRYVPRILEILDEYNVHITFFVTGKFAAANPELVRAMAVHGHEIGNHTWSHPNLDELKKDEIYSEVSRTSDLLESLTGKPVTVFRPPYGHLSGQARSIVNAMGMDAIRWTHESMDARDEASEANSLRYATKDMKGGSIILCHTSAACTVNVLEQILQFYPDNGFEVVPVSQLLLEGDTYVDESGIQHTK